MDLTLNMCLISMGNSCVTAGGYCLLQQKQGDGRSTSSGLDWKLGYCGQQAYCDTLQKKADKNCKASP